MPRNLRRMQTYVPNRPPEVRQANAEKPKPVMTYQMPKEEEIEERPLRVPSFAADVLGVTVLVFGFGFLFSYAVTGDSIKALGFGAAPALLTVIWRAAIVFDKPISYYRHTWWQKVYVPQDDVVEADPNLVAIPGPGGTTVEFWQPQPGEFAAWAASILSDHNKQAPPNQRVTLSQNTARLRGWSIRRYRATINALENAGWLLADGQYILFSASGEEYIGKWLSSDVRR